MSELEPGLRRSGSSPGHPLIWRTALVLSVGLLTIGSVAMAADEDFRLELRDGAPRTIREFEIADATLTIRGPQPASIPLSEITSLRRTNYLDDWSQRSTMIWLTNGDRLIGDPIELNEDSLTVRWLQFPANDSLTIPLEHVASLFLQSPASAERRQKLFRLTAAETQRGDVAWLESGDRVSGELTELTQGEFVFRTETGKLPILREKLLAVRFDPELAAPIKSPETRYLLSFSDGSRLTAAHFERKDSRLSCTTVFGAKASLPAEALIGVQVFSASIQPLSERKPADVEFTPYLSGEWPLVVDRNVLRGPLQIRGREFAFGLGVHSRTLVSYSLEPEDREFRAVVGIDDLADEGGHVVYTIAVDDRVVWESPGVTGTSPPLTVPPISLRGGKRLTLTVDFGEFGDVRDYAGWCDPIILRNQ